MHHQEEALKSLFAPMNAIGKDGVTKQ